jgi:hypothetical protein
MNYSNDHDKHDSEDSRPCSECDIGALDDLKCEAEGIAKRAELMKEAAPKLDERRKKYDEARKSYAKARGEAGPQVAELREQAAKLKDELQCLIKDDHTIECLERAHRTVQDRIKKCGHKSGCCVEDDCEFDTDVPKGDPAEMLKELYSRQADVKRRTEQAEWCFDNLIDEPKNLAERIRKLREELGRIATEKGGDPKTVDFKRLYARLLVAEWGIKDTWRGFKDVNAYVDCLCQGLVCSLKGRQALAILGAKIAVLECEEREKVARCKRLQDDTVEEVLAEYLRICSPKSDQEENDQGSYSAV